MSSLTSRLVGRRALVTGASRGIGLAVAVHFALEGAAVIVNARQDNEQAQSALAACRQASRSVGHSETGHRIIEADVSSAPDVDEMFAEATRSEPLHILVNNARIQAPTPGDGTDNGEVERIIAINLMGAAYCARAAIRHFLSRPGGGVVINTSSVHELIPKPGYLAYSMSKGGLGNLTRTLALEFADRGIRVNAVGPGAILTSLNDSWRHEPDARASVESHIPMGYAATPEAIAPVFAFLASDEASYITGQTLYADGGLTLYGDFKENWSS